MSVTQTDFRTAILDSDLNVPDGLKDAQGRPAGRRFDVYRNNVAVSLTEALQAGFPVVFKLLGTQNFKAIAGVFLRRNPPSNPMMMHYGAEFPDFLRGFEPLSHLGYLGDVADLELALRRSYHAADCETAGGDVLARIPAAQLETLRIGIAPSVEVLSSPWPIHDIWAFNQVKGAPKPRSEAQDVLVTRHEFDPEPHLLPPGGARFVAALMTGTTLGKAASETTVQVPEFDLSTVLTLLLTGNAITTATI
ncbi:Putative DNA-binding domain-containing protein [Shimia gijangensis]|uniref:Putative DNA-binding domain-containing protein n=1 Tax=Shimia gijangensis TaxID=1470563 RepID=A0A1M6DWQ0_9RHOB|nr:DNA-binding domain-containing protein [Shimia gijangensis]SHI77573.1 Putative DNA-binding domain-containing protein [Shimia gijangensis]